MVDSQEKTPQDTQDGDKAADAEKTEEKVVHNVVDADKVLNAFNEVADRLTSAKDQGDTQAVESAASQMGMSVADMDEFIQKHSSEGNYGEGVSKILGAMQVQNANVMKNQRGQDKVEQLAFNSSGLKSGGKVSEAYAEHGDAFTAWMGQNRLQYSGLSGPGIALKTFKYFVSNETDWDEKQQVIRDARVKEELTESIRKEAGLRTSRPAEGSLRVGGGGEGGSLKDSIRAAQDEAGELTEAQIRRCKDFGMTDEEVAAAGKAQQTKTMMGVPVDFIQTRNEGNVT